MALGEDLVDDYVPGLRTLPETIEHIRHVFETGDLGALADPTRIDSYVVLLLAAGGAWLVLCILVRQMRTALFPARPVEQSSWRGGDSEDVKRPTNTALLRRLWWHVRPPADIMRVDGLVIARTGNGSHGLWLGPTGSGKSASVATVRCDGKRPMLAVMPDKSDPLCERADFIWTACEGPRPVNFLLGEPSQVAEKLTEVFRSGGNGAWKRATRLATADVIRGIDTGGTPRSLRLIGELLKEKASHDRQLLMVAAGWIDRFMDLADQFGESIGEGGVDLAELLNAGQMVVLDNDAMEHSSLGADVVALGLAEARRLANLVPGGFRLVFEEAQQLGDRIDLAHPFFLAGRRRRIAVDALAQSEDVLDTAITQNARTKVYFSQEDVKLQKRAAERLALPHTELDPGTMEDFTAWVSHGKIRRLVRFPKPPKAQVYRGETYTPEKGRQHPGDVGGRQIEIWQVMRPWAEPEPVVELPALPPPSTVFQKYLDGTYRERGCLRWRGKHDRKGYGYIYLEEEEKSQLVHRWRWEQAYGVIGKDPVTGKKLTVDHRDSCYRDCSELTHLRLLTRGKNSEARWAAERNGVTHG